MNPPAPPAAAASSDGAAVASRLGFAPGQVVQEFGWDDDVPEELRRDLEAVIGSGLEDEDYTGIADAVLLWWRAEDGDLTDALVDLVGIVADGGFLVLLTPRGHGGGDIEPAEIEEAATTAGLHSSTALKATAGWRAVKLVAPKTAKAPRR